MRILYVLPALQHPTVRGPHRHYHFVRELSAAHEITLLAPLRAPVGKAALSEVASHCERLLTFPAHGESDLGAEHTPSLARRIENRMRLRAAVTRMKAAFEDLAATGGYDLVVFHGKSVFPVIERWSALPIVIDFCDATSMRIRDRLRYARLSRIPFLLRRYLAYLRVERKMLAKTPHVMFISGRDRDAAAGRDLFGLGHSLPASPGEILPNGVDLAYWRRESPLPDAPRVAFSGVMDYAPNHDAACHLVQHVLPRSRQHVPDMELIIVGRNPKPDLLAKSRGLRGVTVTGAVDDMRPHLERAAVFAAPLRYASGMQNKILEAMAMQLPVLTTPIAAAGLAIADDRTDSDGSPGDLHPPIHVAGGDEAFVDALTALLRNPEERERLAAGSRRFVDRHFDWTRSAARLERMCTRAAGSHEKR